MAVQDRTDDDRTTAPSTISQDSIQALSPRAQRAAEWALLNELASLLGMAQEEIQDLRDSGTRDLREGYDARAHIGYILETVEVLDALGWRHAIVSDEDLAEITKRHVEERAAATESS
jgi:hypothetical protein